ncbi:MAG: ArsR family transcriptional regulator [Bacteroidetes bacterium]|nr:MAG: ArsR family transcriptional regulator [Bacteroidota bacterium]
MLKHIRITKPGKKDIYLCEECLELFRAMADKTRQEIIMVFAAKKEICANDIAKNFTLSRPTISHHLNLMKRSKILNSRKQGKEVYYSFNKDYVISLMESVFEMIKRCC